MTRAQFLNDLYRRLAGNGMKADQAEQHLTYYAEMLADRMEEGMTEAQAVSRMEDVDTIARRILEEEGLPYRPPEEIVTPPEYPDASRLGGGGGKRGYQVPKKWNRRRLAQVALWALAIAVALGAASRWMFGRGRNYRTDASIAMPDSVEQMAPMAEAYEGYGLDLPYEYGYEYGSGSTFTSGSIKKLDIEWAAGTVFVQSWSQDDIMVQEFSHSEPTDRNMMVVEDTGDELTIRYRSGTSLGSVKGDKWLTVMVPDRMLEELRVQTTSANVQMNGLEQGAVSVSTASGYISLAECYLQRAELQTISGDVSLSGVYGSELDVSTTSGYVSGDAYCVGVGAETISGNVRLTTWENTETVGISTTSGDVWCSLANTAIRSVGVGTTSGDVSLSIPWNIGFSLEYSTVSGDLANSFDMVRQNGKDVYNGGGCEIRVDTVSGDLDIY